ncbi:MAG: ATP-binding cassette domain-containing protein, partial [Desulfobacterales bacterium]
MADNNNQNNTKDKTVGYGLGSVDTVISVDEVEREAARLAAEGPTREHLGDLVDKDPILTIEGLLAGYGKMMVLHDFNLQVKAGQSLCMIGPNGAGKSTALHSIYGFTTITGGTIKIRDKDITRLSPNEKLKHAGIAYILQDASIFPE